MRGRFLHSENWAPWMIIDSWIRRGARRTRIPQRCRPRPAAPRRPPKRPGLSLVGLAAEDRATCRVSRGARGAPKAPLAGGHRSRRTRIPSQCRPRPAAARHPRPPAAGRAPRTGRSAGGRAGVAEQGRDSCWLLLHLACTAHVGPRAPPSEVFGCEGCRRSSLERARPVLLPSGGAWPPAPPRQCRCVLEGARMAQALQDGVVGPEAHPSTMWQRPAEYAGDAWRGDSAALDRAAWGRRALLGEARRPHTPRRRNMV